MSAAPEFFATDDALAQLEATLQSAVPGERCASLVALAWQLRQREHARAQQLCVQARKLLDSQSPLEQRQLTARLELTEGNLQWLEGALASSQQSADHALLEFTALQDPIGVADAQWLRAEIAQDRGDQELRRQALNAVASAVQELDPVRATAARMATAILDAFRDVASALQRFGIPTTDGTQGVVHPAAASWVETYVGTVGMLNSDYVLSIRHGSNAYASALASGQMRRAIIAAVNVGDDFNSLNDHHSALDWMQRGHDLARTCGWTSLIGQALMQTAETLRQLRRFDAAADMLRDALELMAPIAGSRTYAVALQYLADVELNRKRYPDALEAFRQLELRMRKLDQADLMSAALRGRAHALLELGQAEPALEAAQEALVVAKSDAYRQIAALRVLADIHTRHKLAPPGNLQSDNVALYYLQQALDAAAGIENYTVPAALLEALAREYAKTGDTAQAYALAMQANQARETIQSAEASNRASAMQVAHETEKARVAGEHHRQLALANAERLKTLEQLGVVGREITAQLNTGAIFASLDQHVHALLDVFTFVIMRLDPQQQTLHMVFGVENGQALPALSIAMDNPDSLAARCARERRESIANITPDKHHMRVGTGTTLSQMFAPLIVGERLLGVMTIQSRQPEAYAEREVAIFHTLCSYAAIALANAEAQAELLKKNQELETLSISDKLTGLFNRLRLDQVLKEELARNERTGTPMSVILLDIDHFKSVNDHYGHQTGDQVLVAIAQILKEGSRALDVVGRWGGEEFLIVCRDTAREGAQVLAEKLRDLVAGVEFAVVGHKTASFGVATLGDPGNINALIARADVALYRAKNSGRNRVEVEA